jgi:hypothetical protein
MGGSDVSFCEEDVLEIIVAGRHNRSAFVDLGRVKQIEYGEMLDGQNPVHALKTQSTLAIQEVGDMSLLESGLLCQTEAGQISLIDALPKSIAQIVLQNAKFHKSKYSMYSNALIRERFPQHIGYINLDWQN